MLPLVAFLPAADLELEHAARDVAGRLGARDATNYSEIASEIGAARAVRAVGSAVGSNPVGYLIPCHHVLRKSGGLGGYRWGEDRKRAMLAWESMAAQRDPRAAAKREPTQRAARAS